MAGYSVAERLWKVVPAHIVLSKNSMET